MIALCGWISRRTSIKRRS
ncbi:TPA: hypothetical protein N0F65_001948 [Lagenidium giganteum]|uniref:Uncharacterized protein n=1 Tax=Lagenidium giganteum TaxID=4803 RepID=A0AAV2YW59_9STRA|nr:TPA: hypothetical protein N0F65_001948 [Lagenidium giganteum]